MAGLVGRGGVCEREMGGGGVLDFKNIQNKEPKHKSLQSGHGGGEA